MSRCGGTLHIDIPGHDNCERENIQPLRHSSKAIHRFAAVNSSHHQALERLADGMEVEAWSSSDGIVEQARLRSHPYAIGVQYHPERDPLYLPLFADFFDRVQRYWRIRCLRFASVAVSTSNANRRRRSYCWSIRNSIPRVPYGRKFSISGGLQNPNRSRMPTATLLTA